MLYISGDVEIQIWQIHYISGDVSPALWVHGTGEQLLQFYTDSDKLSAYFSMDPGVSVAAPVAMTSELLIERAMEAVYAATPRLTWITPPKVEGSKVPHVAQMTCKIAEYQMKQKRYFIIERHNGKTSFSPTKRFPTHHRLTTKQPFFTDFGRFQR